MISSLEPKIKGQRIRKAVRTSRRHPIGPGWEWPSGQPRRRHVGRGPAVWPGPCAGELAVPPRVGRCCRLSPGPLEISCLRTTGGRGNKSREHLSAIHAFRAIGTARSGPAADRRTAPALLATGKTTEISDQVRTCVHCIWPGAATWTYASIDRSHKAAPAGESSLDKWPAGQ
jgi:hypothetical protein